MTEADWLACDDPAPMVQFLGGQLSIRKRRKIPKSLRDRLSARKLRLFGCACCRRVWDRLTSEFARKAVEVAERYADQEASGDELLDAYETAMHTAPHSAPGWPDSDPDRDETGRLKDASDYPGFQAHQAVLNVSWSNFAYTANLAENAGEGRHVERAAQCHLLRCIVGNPFRPVGLAPSWITSTVVQLAQGIYAERAFDRLPILADALQDAGCDNPDILAHCRGDGPHVRGCWVVDLVLGRV
jgi:hypothetical protein